MADFQRPLRGLQVLFPAARGSYGDLNQIAEFVQPVHDPFRPGFASSVRTVFLKFDGLDGNATTSQAIAEPSIGTWHLPVALRIRRRVATAAARLRSDAAVNPYHPLWPGWEDATTGNQSLWDAFTPTLDNFQEFAHFPIPQGIRWTVEWTAAGVGALVDLRYFAFEIPGELLTLDRLVQSIRR